jgi:triosephosphate isomerase
LARPTRRSIARSARRSASALTPIVCIGETLDQRERNETLDILDRQIKSGLDGVTAEQLARLVLAYEPVWAIGTGRNATPVQAGEAHNHIRQRLRQWFGVEAADRCRVIYGGSVKPENIRDLVAQPDVDGALVGGASPRCDGVFRHRQECREGVPVACIIIASGF